MKPSKFDGSWGLRPSRLSCSLAWTSCSPLSWTWVLLFKGYSVNITHSFIFSCQTFDPANSTKRSKVGSSREVSIFWKVVAISACMAPFLVPGVIQRIGVLPIVQLTSLVSSSPLGLWWFSSLRIEDCHWFDLRIHLSVFNHDQGSCIGWSTCRALPSRPSSAVPVQRPRPWWFQIVIISWEVVFISTCCGTVGQWPCLG